MGKRRQAYLTVGRLERRAASLRVEILELEARLKCLEVAYRLALPDRVVVTLLGDHVDGILHGENGHEDARDSPSRAGCFD